MALKVHSSFSSGEIDEALRERTTLERFSSSLALARNVVIGKTGRIISRAGSEAHINAKDVAGKPLFYVHPNPTGGADHILEFGHQYVRLHPAATEIATTYATADLPNLRFTSSGNFVYIFCSGKDITKLQVLAHPNFTFVNNPLTTPILAVIYAVHEGGTGLDTDHCVTAIYKGEESALGLSAGPVASVINASEQNALDIRVDVPPEEVRVFRRFYDPPNVGGFGYIGSLYAGDFAFSSTPNPGYYGQFIDRGQEADFEQAPPGMSYIDNNVNDPVDAQGRVGAIYQGRLLITRNDDLEAIEASRPRFQRNFMRDYPLSASSALVFKAGASGSARPFWFMEKDGLIVFTSQGVFLHQGALSPTNLGLDKKAEYVCDPNLPPLELPGAIIFRDIKSNTIRALIWDENSRSYLGEEVSIFSDHLFRDRTIVSWAFAGGEIPLLYVVFDDGRLATFTYLREHQMKAWTQVELSMPAYQVVADSAGNAYVLVKDPLNSYYNLVKMSSRTLLYRRRLNYIAGRNNVDPFFYFNGLDVAFSITELNGRNVPLNSTGTTFNLAPVTAGVWDGPLTLSASANTFSSGDVGKVFRVYGPKGEKYDLVVTAYASATSITVETESGEEFPSTEASNVELWNTLTSVTFSSYSFTHPWGTRPVTLVADGAIYPDLTISGGVLTFPAGVRATHVHIGYLFTWEAETLNIATVEQRPVLLESVNVNKLYVSVFKSRTFYVGNEFPEAQTSVEGMVEVSNLAGDLNENDDNLIEARTRPLTSKRYEIVIPGEWNSGGRICMRGFGYEPCEILSIIPDITDLKRGE